MADVIGVALFGIGRAGMIHFGNLRANHRVEILYIVERDRAKAEQLVEKYRMTNAKVADADDAKEVFLDSRVAAVIVCAPTFEHEAIVRSALHHGKAVFCEKPISQNIEGTKSCYDEAQKAHKPLFCSFNRRFDPSLAALRQRARNGEIGTIQVVKTCSRDSPLPSTDYLKISGGMFHDCAVHDIDQVCWILGDYPTSVFTMAHAHIPAIRELNDVDTVAITMKFASGALATIDLSRFSIYGYDQRVEVFGNKGMLASENQKPTELTAYGHGGLSQDCIKYSFPQRYAESYVGSMQHFLNVVQGLEEMSIGKTDTVNVTIIASACEESYHSGKPVELNLSAKA